MKSLIWNYFRALNEHIPSKMSIGRLFTSHLLELHWSCDKKVGGKFLNISVVILENLTQEYPGKKVKLVS